jgi:hypothetical protein
LLRGKALPQLFKILFSKGIISDVEIAIYVLFFLQHQGIFGQQPVQKGQRGQENKKDHR